MDNTVVDGECDSSDQSSVNVSSAAIELAVNRKEAEPTMTEYNVHQINVEPGGQVLDCKVSRDEQTGLPRVEMVFCINPLLQSSDGADAAAGGIQLFTDSSSDVTVTSLDSNDSGCISPAELLLVEPPEICLRPVLPVATAPDAVTSSSDETAAFESGNSMELLYRRHDIEQLQSPLTCISSSKCDTAGGSDDVEVTQTSHNHVDKWRNRLEKRNIVRRVLLLTASVIDGKDDVAAIFLLAIITILFLVFWFFQPPFVTAVSLICFTACLLEFLRLQPAIDDYFCTFTNMSPNDESRLESLYARISTAECRLLSFWSDMRTLKNDRPAAFLLVSVCALYFIIQLGQAFNGDFSILLYLAAALVVTVPAVITRVRKQI